MNKALIIFVIASILTIVLFVGIEFMNDGHSDAATGLVNEVSEGMVHAGL